MKTIPVIRIKPYKFSFNTRRDVKTKQAETSKSVDKTKSSKNIIGVAYKEGTRWIVVPLDSSIAKQKSPEVVKMLNDTFRTYPKLKQEIEKREKQWRKQRRIPVFFNMSYTEAERRYGYLPYVVGYPLDSSSNPLQMGGSRGGRIGIDDIPQWEIDKINEVRKKMGVPTKLKKTDLVAFTILHELKHEDQLLGARSFRGQQLDYQKYRHKFERKYKGVSPEKLVSDEGAAKLYIEENPYEKEAYEYGLRKLKEMRKRS